MSATAFALPPRESRADRPTAGIALTANVVGQDALLTPAVLALLVSLHRAIEPERQARLAARRERQAFFDAGGLPDFRADTRTIRDGDWTVAPCRPRCRTVGWKSPGRWTRRWSSTR